MFLCIRKIGRNTLECSSGVILLDELWHSKNLSRVSSSIDSVVFTGFPVSAPTIQPNFIIHAFHCELMNERICCFASVFACPLLVLRYSWILFMKMKSKVKGISNANYGLIWVPSLQQMLQRMSLPKCSTKHQKIRVSRSFAVHCSDVIQCAVLVLAVLCRPFSLPCSAALCHVLPCW